MIRSSLHSIAVAAAALGVVGCGAPEGVWDESTGTITQALSTNWRSWGMSPSDSTGFTDSPAVCPVHKRSDPGASGVMLLARGRTSNKFRVSIYEKLRPWMSWTNLSGSPTFNSKPACASLDELNLLPPSSWNNQYAIVGKRSSTTASQNNRFYVQVMKYKGTTFDQQTPPSPPTVVTSWRTISSDSYASAPAAAMLGGNLVVAGRRSDNRIYVHVNPMNTTSTTAPYDHSKWEAAVQTPALPTGWTAIGSPSIGAIGQAIGEGIIATRAQNSRGTVRIYTYYMYVPWRTVGGFKLDQGSWNQLPATQVVSSDVALEFETRIQDRKRTTAYFRSRNAQGVNRIYQASGDGFNWDAFTEVTNPYDTADDYTDFANAPGVLGSSELEGGHIVASRRADNQIWWAGLVPGAGY